MRLFRQTGSQLSRLSFLATSSPSLHWNKQRSSNTIFPCLGDQDFKAMMRRFEKNDPDKRVVLTDSIQEVLDEASRNKKIAQQYDTKKFFSLFMQTTIGMALSMAFLYQMMVFFRMSAEASGERLEDCREKDLSCHF